MSKAKKLREAWADASHALWEAVYKEEDGDHLDLLRANRWAWAIGVDEDYCGHTHAVAGQLVGDHLHESMCLHAEVKPSIRRKIIPSTSRLAGKVKGAEWDVEPEKPRPREIAKGDLVTVGEGKPWGHHIVMAWTSPDRDGNFETIEGNSTGHRGDGSWGRGIVKKSRNIEEVACVYRLGEEHFNG